MNCYSETCPFRAGGGPADEWRCECTACGRRIKHRAVVAASGTSAEPAGMRILSACGPLLGDQPADGCLVDLGSIALALTDGVSQALTEAICAEMQRRGVRETYFVSAEFVREAIREKLERAGKQHEETAEKAQDGGGSAGADGL